MKIVPGAGLEPARPNGHMALNHACLPIPAPGWNTLDKYTKRVNSKIRTYSGLSSDLAAYPEESARMKASFGFAQDSQLSGSPPTIDQNFN